MPALVPRDSDMRALLDRLRSCSVRLTVIFRLLSVVGWFAVVLAVSYWLFSVAGSPERVGPWRCVFCAERDIAYCIRKNKGVRGIFCRELRFALSTGKES